MSDSPPAVSAGPLAGLSADQIAVKASADLFAATSLRMVGSRVGSSPGTFDLDMAPGRGCTGTMDVIGSGKFQIVVVGKQVWIKPDAAYWKGQKVSAAVLRRVSGKFLRGSTASTGLGVLATLCVLSHTSTPSAAGAGEAVTFEGQKAFAFGTPDDRAIISDSAKPEPLQISRTGPDALTMTFSDYNAPVRLVPPPASETVDGADYGM